MGKLFNEGSVVKYVDDDGTLRWSSEAAPVALLPEEYAIELNSYSVTFPDLEKNNAYGLDFFELFDLPYTVAASYVTWVPQKWGPAEGGGKALAPDLVGTVPNGTNYLDVRVNMSRTTSPSQWLGKTIPAMLLAGKEYDSQGGSVPCERIANLARSFEVKLDGTNVYINRVQSVKNTGDAGIWTPGNAVFYPNGGTREGWTHGGRADGHFAALIETKGPGVITGAHRGGPNGCSLTDPTNYTSVYTGSIKITPGYVPN